MEMMSTLICKVDDTKTHTPPETNTLKVLYNKCILTMRIFATLTSWSCPNKTLNPLNFCTNIHTFLMKIWGMHHVQNRYQGQLNKCTLEKNLLEGPSWVWGTFEDK